MAQNCLRTTERVIEALIGTASAGTVGGEIPLRFCWSPCPSSSCCGRFRSAVPGFIGVVFGARDGVTDVPRTSLGAGTRCPLSGPSCPATRRRQRLCSPPGSSSRPRRTNEHTSVRVAGLSGPSWRDMCALDMSFVRSHPASSGAYNHSECDRTDWRRKNGTECLLFEAGTP